jgi:hypothetical protein
VTFGGRLAVCALLLPAVAPAALFHRKGTSSGQRSPAITLRKRLHVNTLITAPEGMILMRRTRASDP